ncbi:aminopeptidase [Blastomyces dermatitidis ER-3]|uniref:Peptide hydrolase n=1 Tax=Ajellomyces dermatitidis (strain ER-3 / ATCC MYA-2586) TaxID=559297 RepID=A0ABM9YH72_AJEDR|nr:aminopeptidase [Blastomyces dermatitidis ER-3]EEQ88518.1 aminopeptidase [Blastomyces dermatitidis ER-3]
MKVQLLALGAALGAHLAVAETPDVETQGFPGFPDFPDFPKFPFPGDWYNRFRQVSPEKLMWFIRERDLKAGAKKLESLAYASPGRNRVFGTEGHEATIDYLVKELKRTRYYDVSKQEQVHLWSKSEATLKVNGENKEVLPMTYSPSGDAKAELVLVNNLGCVPADFPPEVNGKIALILRGECPFGLKSALAGSAKAVGALIYNNIPGSLSGTLGAPSNPAGPYPPTVGVSKEIGDDLAARLGSGTLMGELFANSQFENRTTYNVIATSKGGDKNNIIAIGGHSDSVEAGPGINDNGSGIIGNLAIAKALARFKVPNAVRFLFWTAEEYGLLGSQYYVDNLSPEERDKIRLYLNFDMTASPNYAYMIYDGDGSTFNFTGPSGSAEIEKLFQKYYEDRRTAHIPSEFDGRSDYDAFISVGIPAGGIFTGAEGIKTQEQAKMFGGTAGIAYDSNYHGVGDDANNVNMKAWMMNTKGAAYALATYARSTKSLPPKDPPPKQARALGTGGVKPFNGKCDDIHGHGRRCTY